MIHLAGSRSTFDGAFTWSCWTGNVDGNGYNLVSGTGPTPEAATYQALSVAERRIDMLLKQISEMP